MDGRRQQLERRSNWSYSHATAGRDGACRRGRVRRAVRRAHSGQRHSVRATSYRRLSMIMQLRRYERSTVDRLRTASCTAAFFALASASGVFAQDPTCGKNHYILTGSVISWTSTSNLNVARSGHTATLLPDGKV